MFLRVKFKSITNFLELSLLSSAARAFGCAIFNIGLEIRSLFDNATKQMDEKQSAVTESKGVFAGTGPRQVEDKIFSLGNSDPGGGTKLEDYFSSIYSDA